jgi:predicted nucleotidyltransferase
MLSEEIKSEIKKRLLAKFDLRKIILFGSQARGTADNRSDIDLLVISDVVDDKFKMMDQLRHELLPMNYAFDVIVQTEEEYERDKKYPGYSCKIRIKRRAAYL